MVSRTTSCFICRCARDLTLEGEFIALNSVAMAHPHPLKLCWVTTNFSIYTTANLYITCQSAIESLPARTDNLFLR